MAKRGTFNHGPKSATSSAPKAAKSGGYVARSLKAPKGSKGGGGSQHRDSKGRFSG